jgi:myo-inositol-hexaphosphate 3-phosphohydrolase
MISTQIRRIPTRQRLTVSLAASALLSTAVPALAAGDWVVKEVAPTLQTPALTAEDHDANADDPSIYVDASDSTRSFVASAGKEGGIRVYGLDGALRQSILCVKDGRINNVDVVYDFPLADGTRADLVVASDRGLDIIRVYRIDAAAAEPLTEITDESRAFPQRPTTDGKSVEDNPVDDQATVYGLTAWHDTASDTTWVVGTQRHQPVVGVFKLEAREGGKVGVAFDHDFRAPITHMGQDLWQESDEDALKDFSPQFEGVVIDHTTGVIYAGQEDVGIWRVAVTGGDPVLAYQTRGASTSSFFNPDSVISRDVEGLSIYYAASGTKYLLASSQGGAHGGPPVTQDPPYDDSFAVFGIGNELKLLGSFRVGTADGIDAVQESDGADVTSVALPNFPNGVFITQDGYAADLNNLDGETESTNFKYVDWAAIAATFAPPLEVTPSGWDPRK